MSRYRRDDDDDLPDDDDRASSRRRRDEDDDYDSVDLGRRLLPHRGTMILVFGLIGLIGGLFLFFPAVLGVVAWVMGHNDLKSMSDGHMDPEGQSNTYAGYVMGIIASVIAVIWVIVALVSVLVPVVLGLGMFGLCAGCACCGAAAGPPPNAGPPPRRF